MLSDKTLHISAPTQSISQLSLKRIASFNNLFRQSSSRFYLQLFKSASSQPHSAPCMQAPSSKKGFYASGPRFLLSSRHREGSPHSRRAFLDGHGLQKRQSINRNRQTLYGETECPSWSPAVSWPVGCSALIGLRALKWAIWHMFEGLAAKSVCIMSMWSLWLECIFHKYEYKWSFLHFRTLLCGAWGRKGSNWQRHC